MQRKTSSGLWQIALSVSALALAALLLGNVVIMLLASGFNNDVCSNAAEVAANTYETTGNLKELQSAVFSVLNRDSWGGFFISSPMLAELKCYSEGKKGHKRTMLAIKTTISVRLPAMFLTILAKPDHDGRLLLNSKRIIELKPSSV